MRITATTIFEVVDDAGEGDVQPRWLRRRMGELRDANRSERLAEQTTISSIFQT